MLAWQFGSEIHGVVASYRARSNVELTDTHHARFASSCLSPNLPQTVHMTDKPRDGRTGLRRALERECSQDSGPNRRWLQVRNSNGLRVRHPADGEPWEYTVVVSIRNDRGEEIAHKLIGVGAMHPSEQRTFTLLVEAVSAKTKSPGKGGTRH